jgi:hypothetical protein
MNALVLIQLAISLLGSVLSGIKGTQVPQEIAAEVQGAIQKLESVIGTPVTYGQLEGLKLTINFAPKS